MNQLIPIYLLAFAIALAKSGTNIYDVHARNLGTIEAEPWHRKSSGFARDVLSVFARFVRFAWPHRQRVAVIVAAAVFLLVAPHNAHAHGASICVVAGHVAQLESDLKAKQAAAKTLLEKTMRTCAEHVVTPAAEGQPEVKGRIMTAEEKAAIQTILDEAKGIKARIDGTNSDAALQAEIDRLTAGMGDSSATQQQAVRETRSLGAQFVADPNYRAWIKAGQQHRTGAVSPEVELHATTLDTTAGSGGPLIIPDYQPGVVPLLFKRLVVADLIAPGTTTGNLIQFMKETTFTNAAAAVAQGATKPESTLIFATATSAVQKIAHWIPVTEEMLEDYAQTQSIIDARLRLGLALVEEDQLLNGTGVSPNLLGFMNLAGLTAAQARGADTNADAIFKAITTLSTTVFVVPDAFVINPINWQTIQLTKNAAGNYLGSGPWAPAQPASLWGLPGAVTPSIVANTALVGGFRSSAQYFRKGGVRVEASNSHSDFFVKNLVAIRGEQRGALAVYRESAFEKVTGLN